MRPFVRDVSWTTASHAVVAASTIALQVIVVRTVSPLAFGQYATAAAIASLVEWVVIGLTADLSLQTVGGAWAAGRFEFARACVAVIRRRDLLTGGTVAATGIGIAAAWPYGDPTVRHLVAGLLLMIPCQFGYGISKSLFIVSGNLGIQARLEIATGVVQLLFGATGAILFGLPGLVGLTLLTAFLKTTGSAWLTRRFWPQAVGEEESRNEVKAARAIDWGVITRHSLMRNLSLFGSQQVDTVLLASHAGPLAVGVYRVAKTLASAPARIAGPLWAAVRPRLMLAWHSHDDRRLRRVIGAPAGMLMVGMLVALLPAWLLIPWLLRTVYGPTYVLAAEPFMYLLIGAWVLNAATAWFPFWVIISAERWRGTLTFTMQLGLLLVGGLLVGRHGAVAMSKITCGAMILTAAACWGVLGHRITHRPAVTAPIRPVQAEPIAMGDDSC